MGITTNTPKKRFNAHTHAARYAKANSPAVYHAWNKHGAPAMVILAVIEDEDLYEAEKRAIVAYGTISPNGYNLTHGGECGCSKHPEVREKISAALTTPEMRAKRSASKKEMWSDPEYRAKKSAANKEIWSDPEKRAKQSDTLKAKWSDNEFRAKTSAALKAKWSDPEYRAKQSAARKALFADPEYHAKLSAAQKGRRHTMETRAKQSVAAQSRSPETIAKLSAAAKAAWAAKKLKEMAE